MIEQVKLCSCFLRGHPTHLIIQSGNFKGQSVVCIPTHPSIIRAFFDIINFDINFDIDLWN